MGSDSSFNDKQPEEAPGKLGNTSGEFGAGDKVFVLSHTFNMSGVIVPFGGYPAEFIRIREEVSKEGDMLAEVYANGHRIIPLKYVSNTKSKRIVDGGVEMPLDGPKQGDIIIRCNGVPKKPCDKSRQVHAADKHKVIRCSECQIEFGRIASRKRMRKLRAKYKKNAK